MKSILNEKHYRVLPCAFLLYIPGNARGAVAWPSKLTGACRDTISRGRQGILSRDPHIFDQRIRRAGAGRKRVETKKPGLMKLVEKS